MTEHKLPELQRMLASLVATPSISSVSPDWDQSNEAVVDLLANWCHDAGFRVEKIAVPDCPGKFNLLASIGNGADGLVLSGHTDTVPCDEHRWNSDPFELVARDDRWYGLGSTDMKGFFALILEAVRSFDLSRIERPLIILATADEESTMCGARSLLTSARQLGRHAVIGEPTDLKPVRLHKGIAMEAIRVRGKSGHSSDPALGNSALEGMHRVIGEILAWRASLQARHGNPLFRVPVPTLNLGHIHGGDNPNRICAECELHIDIRTLPGMNLQELREELDQRLATVLSGTDLQVHRAPLFEGVAAMETPATAAIVEASERLTGYPAEAVAFATEGPFLNAMDMETVILGPGSIDQAHQPDEYLPMAQIQPGLKIIRNLIRQFCFPGNHER